MADRVLITGARAAAALDLARSFRAAGWEPHLADCSEARIVRWSNAPQAVHRYPAPTLHRAAFRERIAALVEALDVRLVVPTCEEVFHLAAPALADALAGRLFAPPLATLGRLHDKLAFSQACTAWGLPAPESHSVDRPADLARISAESDEWVVKPRFSRFGESAMVGPRPVELDRLAITPDRPWLAQRRVRGREVSFYAVARQGLLTAFAAYRSDWRLRGGASFAFEPLGAGERDMLREIASALGRAAAITGQFACDAMIDGEGQAWLLECNPRATSGVHLLAGDDRLARAIATGCDDPLAQSAATAYLAPAMVLFGLPHAIRTGVVGHWRRTMADGCDVLARPGDRVPLAGALADAMGFAVTGLRRGISTSAATTHDIEWNGEELA